MKKITVLALVIACLLGISLSIPKLTDYYVEKKNNEALAAMEEILYAEYEAYKESYKDVFYPGSVLNGKNIGGLTIDETIWSVEQAFLQQEIVINHRDASDVFAYKDFSIDFSEFEKFVNNSFDKRKFSLQDYRNGKYASSLSFDMAQCVDFSKIDTSNLTAFTGDDIVKTEDAYISVDVEAGSVAIIEEVYGHDLIEGTLEAYIEDAVRNAKPEINIAESDYKQPAVTSADETLKAAAAKLKIIFNKTIKISLCGEQTELKGKHLWKMLDYDNETGEVLVDSDVVMDYVMSLKRNYDTYGIDRAFHTSTGEDIIVSGGDYGWAIDRYKTTTLLSEAIANNEAVVNFTPEYATYGQHPKSCEIGNTYIEVSIDHQKVWMYINGTLVLEDDCTTGELTKPNYNTNRGVFDLTYKDSPATLYFEGNYYEVSYWMPFDQSIGFHDATWRSDEEFGGTNYIGNGSHGCVNLRLSSAEFIYNNIQKDTPIIIW